MYDKLITYINQYSGTQLSDEEAGAVESLWDIKKLRKNQYFLSEGEICQFTAFITNGAMRQYSVDQNGVEHILQLAIENWWIVDRESFMLQKPSKYFIDAWENTEMLILSSDNFTKAVEIPAIQKMFFTMDQKNHIATQNRLNDGISLSALKRYENLVEAYPELVQRFAQHQVASYLGITKETLSRVRNQLSK